MFSTTDSAVSHWETGISFPDVNTLLKLSDYFGVSLDYLLGRSEFRTNEEALAKTEASSERIKGNLVITDVDNLTDTEKNQILAFADFLKAGHQSAKKD